MEEELDVFEERPSEPSWEEKASAMGWNASYDGDDAVDAREYVLRKPLFDELKKQRRKIRDLETAIRTQEDLKNKIIQKEKDQLLKDLRKQKGQAISEGDGAKVAEIEEQIDETNRMQPPAPSGVPPEFTEWVDKNEWYETDDDMRAWADARGFQMKQKNPNDSMSNVLDTLSREVKKVFPHKFENKNRSKPPAVESGTPPSTETEERSTTIPKEYKRVFERMYASGAWGDTKKKDAAAAYMKDLERAGV